LEKVAHHLRPSAAEPDAVDKIYQDYLGKVINGLETSQNLLPVMREARLAFEELSVGSNEQPWIGIIGEVFVRTNAFSNQDLVRRVEELGGRVWLAPLSEWMFYVNHGQKTDTRMKRSWKEYLNVSVVDRVMRKDEHILAKVWEGFIPHAGELPPEDLIELARDYVDPQFFGEPVVSLGKSKYMHQRGLAGIINVMPFTCMLGTITNGLMRRFQQEHGGMPILNLAFDGQEIADLPIRLEAFIEQCRTNVKNSG
jgi:predicted nucleotide-binding protein (sugar kinase/HSP70/actin superfamily)